MKFKVTLQQRKITVGNPFYPGVINRLSNNRIRVWEIEAENEAKIQQFLDEAVSQDLPNVRGFSLRSIEPMDPTK